MAEHDLEETRIGVFLFGLSGIASRSGFLILVAFTPAGKIFT